MATRWATTKARTASVLVAKAGINPRAVDMKKLPESLHEQGAFVSVGDLPGEALEAYRAIQELILSLPRPELYDEAAKY
ncbi:MAG: hypothetical protein JW943_05480 [Deltaproteobacteria bacterium]|nr:hypothetical protein [Deltaproteobacteria bacterium]